MNIRESFYSLFGPTPNGTASGSSDVQEGVVGELEDELTLKTPDEELLLQANQWRTEADNHRSSEQIDAKAEKNKKYWKNQPDDTDDMRRELRDNIIFESLETSLPIITRQNAEPVVQELSKNPELEVCNTVRDVIMYHNDLYSLRIKIKQVTRHWNLSYIGALKIGWDYLEDDYTYYTVRPKNLILDPNGFVDAGRFFGDYIGELRKVTAEQLATRFEAKKEEIKEAVQGKMGTKCAYTEWWTPTYTFYTFKNIVLAKTKNPHWNYEQTKEVVDAQGNIQSIPIRVNHFTTPQMPYAFLSVYSLQESPYDETNNVEQSLAIQDVLNKRHRQIDKNVDAMNNTVVFNGEVSEEEATRAKAALDQGHAIRLNTKDVNSAFKRDSPNPLPNQVFSTIEDYRNEIRSTMGTLGSTPQSIQNEKTLGGKVVVRSQDIDRSSTVVDHIEQMVDYLFNWQVQMMYVYYTEERLASIVGSERAQSVIAINNEMLFNRKLLISVKEGSMIPKDPLTRADQAIQLYQSGALDLESLFKYLEFPNPAETARRAFLHANNPQELYAPQQPSVEQEMEMPLTELNLPSIN